MEPLDIEAALGRWLSKQLEVPWHADVPKPRPPRLITTERVGGGGDSVVLDRPRVAVQCWAETREKASALAAGVAGLVPRMAEIHRVMQAEKVSQLNFPDLASGSPRYQVVINLVTR
jgi:hypothetical protein